MKFIDKITGNDMKRQLQDMQLRINKLPKEYQEAWEKIQSYIFPYSDLTGRNLMPIFENIVEFLEESAIDCLPVDNIFGGDYEVFSQELLGGENSKFYRDKWRKKLNDTINKKLSKK